MTGGSPDRSQEIDRGHRHADGPGPRSRSAEPCLAAVSRVPEVATLEHVKVNLKKEQMMEDCSAQSERAGKERGLHLRWAVPFSHSGPLHGD